MTNRSLLRTIAPLLLFGLLLWGLASCESDSVAPDDELPPLSQETVRTQAGYAAFLVAQAYDVYQGALGNPKAPAEDREHIFADGGVSGAFQMTFFCGTTECAEDDADNAHIRTIESEGQVVEVRADPLDENPIASAFFDVMVTNYDGTNGAEQGDVTGDGRLEAGLYTSIFIFDMVHLSASDYPESGTMTYISGGNDVAVTFNGTRFATLDVGEDTYNVDLDTGAVIEF